MPYAAEYELLEVHLSGSSITVHGGYSQVEIWSVGGGGSGKRGGGGAGGVAYNLFPILEAEVGTSLTISVGGGGVAGAGGNTTVDGTLNGSAITQLKGFGGGRDNTAPGTGGTASGGSSNSTGDDGEAGDIPTTTPGAGGAITMNLPTGAAGDIAAYGWGGTGAWTTDVDGYSGAVICLWRQ